MTEIIIQKTKDFVANFLAEENSGHGFDHIERVYKNAVKLAKEEEGDLFLVSLASLLHDVDDEKIVGEECAKELRNTRKFLKEIDLFSAISDSICEIISTMSYSKSLEGIVPTTLEGKIVSDADKLDAMGAIGAIRTLVYSAVKGRPIFLPQEFPLVNISKEDYRAKNRKNDTAVNHFFEKLFLLKDMMYTESGKKEAKKRHNFMIGFLNQFFEEQNCGDWIELLKKF